jgi:small-conductance mechanosensitive channel
MKRKNRMKRRELAITFISAAAFAVGCKPAGDQSAANERVVDTSVVAQASRNMPPPQFERAKPEAREAIEAQLEKAKAETREAVQATKEYAYAQKDEFVEKTRGELADLNRQLEQLSGRVETSTDAAKEEGKAKLVAMRERSDKLSKQLDELKSATESTWDEVKTGFNKAYQEMKESFRETREWLSDKIKP